MNPKSKKSMNTDIIFHFLQSTPSESEVQLITFLCVNRRMNRGRREHTVRLIFIPYHFM